MGTDTSSANDLLNDAADCLAKVKTMTGRQYVFMADGEVDKLRDEIEQLTNHVEEMQPLLGKQKTEIEQLQKEPTITPAMAQMLLDAREAHIEGDWDETFHQIRIFAHETTDDIYNSWAVIERIASLQTKDTK